MEDKLPKKIYKARPIERKLFERERVSIIIPFHGQYERATSLIRSIWTYTKSNPYEICLVDDASPNKTFIDKIKDAPQLKVIRTENQLGFGGAAELGFKISTQPWIVIIHSDCLIENSNWLLDLGKSLLNLKDQKVGMVGARSNNPGEYVNENLKSDKNTFINDFILNDEEYLPLYCFMTHRSVFNKVGFIKNYPLRGYEDEEFAYRLRNNGYKQGVSGKSWVRHHGSATLNELYKLNKNISDIIEGNRTKCIEDIKKHAKLHVK